MSSLFKESSPGTDNVPWYNKAKSVVKVAPALAFCCRRRSLVVAGSSAAATDCRNHGSTLDLCRTSSLATDLRWTSPLVLAIAAATPSEAAVHLGGAAKALSSVGWAD
ncbi:unnamed protein product [Citrullus colocynthis]|uniref:Uncharacterized protein n=1 Tax=Citrullus colocynthis TaxID=252529 RepID=A0ABP0Y587_9ROSI